MRKKLTFLFLIFIHVLHGQADSTYQESWYITYSPSAFLNAFPAVQFGFEKVISDRRTIELEVAKMLNLPPSTEDDFDTTIESGYRLKLGYKRRKNTSRLLLLTLYLRHTTADINDWVTRADDAYEERINYRKTKTLIGPTFGFGKIYNTRGILKVEFAANMGLGIYQVKDDLPPDAREPDRLFAVYQNPGDYLYPIIGVSLKLKMGRKEDKK